MIAPFRHREPIVTVEYALTGLMVSILFDGSRDTLDIFVTAEAAARYARETALINGLRFVPGAVRFHLIESEA